MDTSRAPMRPARNRAFTSGRRSRSDWAKYIIEDARRADAQRRSHLGRCGVPWITRPPGTLVDQIGVKVVDRAATFHQLCYRRESACSRGGFRTRPVSNSADHRRVLSGGERPWIGLSNILSIF